MVFKRMLRAMGAGGPSVDTVLASPHARPGETLSGHVNLLGGDHTADIEHVSVALRTRIEVEAGDHEGFRTIEFHKAYVTGRLHLNPGERQAIPFQLPLPWETPLTAVAGVHLRGMTLGVSTDVSVAGAIDKGDVDPITVHPLPGQDRVLDAFGQLGMRFVSADLEQGHIHGLRQELPFYQEIEFHPGSRYRGANQIELTFLTSPHEMVVLLEVDKRGGFLSAGGDTLGRFHVSHEQAMQMNWAQEIDAWLTRVTASRW